MNWLSLRNKRLKFNTSAKPSIILVEFREYSIIPQSNKENETMSTCHNRLDLETVGSRLVMPKISPDTVSNVAGEAGNSSYLGGLKKSWWCFLHWWSLHWWCFLTYYLGDWRTDFYDILHLHYTRIAKWITTRRQTEDANVQRVGGQCHKVVKLL